MRFPAASDILGHIHMGAALHLYVGLFNSPVLTPRCLGGLSRMRSASPVGVCISTASTISRSIPRPQRTCDYAGFRLHLVVEHQVYHRGALGRGWTQRRGVKGEESWTEVCVSEREPEYGWRELCSCTCS